MCSVYVCVYRIFLACSVYVCVFFFFFSNDGENKVCVVYFVHLSVYLCDRE